MRTETVYMLGNRSPLLTALSALVLISAVATPVLAQTTKPYLVKDIRTVPSENFGDFRTVPKDFTRYKSQIFFRGGGGLQTTSTYLWKSDGTPENTTPVATFIHLPNYQPRIEYNGYLFFPASDPATGMELWKSDGTAAGTTLVKDIKPGPMDSNPWDFALFKGRLFFSIRDGYEPPEIWSTDGTAEGTRPLLDYTGYDTVPQMDGSADLIHVGNYLLFIAKELEHGQELWRTDGTATGTLLVRDIFPGPASSYPLLNPEGFLDGRFFFTANDGVHGKELWTTDGTAAGTVLFKDIYPGPGSSNPGYLTPLGDILIFTADDGIHGKELWKTDGTELGTALVHDTVPGPGSPSLLEPYDHAELNGSLFFPMTEPEYGNELWKTDGTDRGTTIVRDIIPGRTGSYAKGFGPSSLFRAGNRILFTSQSYYDELWSTDGTSSGTHLLLNVEAHHQYPSTPVPLGGDFRSATLFGASDPIHGNALWKSDGTTTGTVVVKPMNTRGFSSDPAFLTEWNGNLFFDADDGIHGYQLWMSSGTSPGTRMITDIPGKWIYGCYPTYLTPYKQNLYFITSTAGFDFSLWKTNGTTSGTLLVRPLQEEYIPDYYYTGHGVGIFKTRDTLFYTNNGVQTIQGHETRLPLLWRFDEASSSSTLILSGVKMESITPAENRLFFISWASDSTWLLWVSNGTPEDAHVVKDRAGRTFSLSTSRSTVSIGNTLYFPLSNRLGQLWKTDGTSTGTVLVRDLVDASATGGAIAGDLVRAGKTVYFQAYTAGHGSELWKSDGTASGTMQVAEINPSGNGIYYLGSQDTADVNGTLFFQANDGVHGFELWKTDGTREGTVLVKDIRPGLLSSNLNEFRAANGLLYFSADDGLTGPEPWVSDGTEAGTVRIADLAPGPIGSDPMDFTFAGRHLYFSADDQSGIGRELWAIELTPAPHWNGTGWMFAGGGPQRVPRP